jgi:hypothetical protein
MDIDAIIYVVAGLVAGFIATMAGSGTVITLPLLLFLGVPVSVANGTTRIPILAASATSVLTFFRAKVLDWKRGLLLSIPFILGALAGAELATVIPPQRLKEFIIAAVVFVLILLLYKPKRLLKSPSQATLRMDWKQMLIFFAVGLWAGFILIDSGTFALLALVLGVRFDLTRAVAVKALLVLSAVVASLLLFSEHSDVNWRIGGLLALGSVFGGWAGARIASQEWAKIWVYRCLVFIVVAEIIHLVWRFFFLHLP